MVRTQEQSRLLGDIEADVDVQESLQDFGRAAVRQWQVKTLAALFGFAALLACASSVSSPRSAAKMQMSASPQAFDQKYHAWEASMYAQANMAVPLEGHHKKKNKEPKNVTDVDTMPGGLIYLNNTKGIGLFTSTQPKLTRDFYYYQQGWEAQINQAYCSVASAMAVMNSLRGLITLPQDPIYEPFPWATQEMLIQNECVKANIYDVDKIDHEFWGLGVDKAAELLNCHLQSQGFLATPYHIDPLLNTSGQVRTALMDALADEFSRVMINYDRGGFLQGPMGHGHFSPIGAYNYKKDAFLVMDVAKYKYPPVWVPTTTLMDGIATLDTCSNFTYPDHPIDLSIPAADLAGQIGCVPLYRGFIVISNVTAVPVAV